MPEQRTDTKGHREGKTAGEKRRYREGKKCRWRERERGEGKWVCRVLTFNWLFTGIFDIFLKSRETCALYGLAPGDGVTNPFSLHSAETLQRNLQLNETVIQ